MALICIFPVILVISISFTDQAAISRFGYQIIPSVFSLDAYKFIINANMGIGNAYIVTILATIAGTVVYFCFRPATFLSVFIWMAVIFMAVVAVLISISVTLLKITAGERYYGKAKEVVYKQKESKKEKIK
jgi:ABC-type glycerol-3-phosphate transport system permease component